MDRDWSDKITISFEGGSKFSAKKGVNLRAALLEEGFSPYKGRYEKLNCLGMGICGKCEVFVFEDGQKFSRRACQIRCFSDLKVELQ